MNPKIKTIQMYPQGERPKEVPKYKPVFIPEFESVTIPDLIPEDLTRALTPIEIPSVGDHVLKEGYIESLQFNEYGYSPEVLESPNRRANVVLEQQTYCLVTVSTHRDQSLGTELFRIRYSLVEGEKLATSMAVIAAIKDAFIHQSRVRIHAVMAELNVPGVMRIPAVKSDVFNDLRSVVLLKG